MTVVSLDARRRRHELPLTRADLETRIGYGRSWITARITEGMPRSKDPINGHNIFYASEVQAWLDHNGFTTAARRLGSVGLGHNTPATGGIFHA